MIDIETVARIQKENNKLLELIEEYIEVIDIMEIPNQYSPDSEYYKWFKWFRVNTRYGFLTIGWRKRVINIQWDDNFINNGMDINIFMDEDVTKDRNYIHAWGLEKVKEYLDKIFQTLNCEGLSIIDKLFQVFQFKNYNCEEFSIIYDQHNKVCGVATTNKDLQKMQQTLMEDGIYVRVESIIPNTLLNN